MIDLSILMLAYDEAENVTAVLSELYDWLGNQPFRAEVLLIDDGSRDDTASVAEAFFADQPAILGRVLRHPQNRGMGAGIKTGARAARGEWLTFMPADGQIPPEGIGRLWSAQSEETDLVLSLYEDRDDGAARKVLSWGVRALIEVVHGVRVKSEGPYLIRRALLDPSQLQADTFFLNFEVPIRAAAAGLRTRSVEMACRPRRAGESKTARPGRALRVAQELVAFRGRRLQEALDRALGRGR